MNQGTLVRLSKRFLVEIKGFRTNAKDMVECTDKYREIVYKSFQKLVNTNITEQQLDKMIDHYKLEHDTPSEAYDIDDVIKFYKVEVKAMKSPIIQVNPDNIIQAGKFYYHPALQIAPPPPMVEMLPDGTFKSSYDDEQFFLEIKEEFTLDDLVDYFYRRIPSVKQKYREREKGAFKHMLKSTDPDIILYSIDEGAVAEDVPTCAFDIQEFIENAEYILQGRKNTLYMEGLDHVIPRSK